MMFLVLAALAAPAPESPDWLAAPAVLTNEDVARVMVRTLEAEMTSRSNHGYGYRTYMDGQTLVCEQRRTGSQLSALRGLTPAEQTKEINVSRESCLKLAGEVMDTFYPEGISGYAGAFRAFMGVALPNAVFVLSEDNGKGPPKPYARVTDGNVAFL